MNKSHDYVTGMKDATALVKPVTVGWIARAQAAEAEVEHLRAQLAQAWDAGYDAGYTDDDSYHKGLNEPLAKNPYINEKDQDHA